MKNLKDLLTYYPGFLMAVWFLISAGIFCYIGLLYLSVMVYIIAVICCASNVTWWGVLLQKEILGELRKLNHQIKRRRKEIDESNRKRA